MFNGVLPRLMEKFAVRRGIQKSLGGNAGLAKLATEYFENINANGGIKEMNKENIKFLSKFLFKLIGGAVSGLSKENIRM